MDATFIIFILVSAVLFGLVFFIKGRKSYTPKIRAPRLGAKVAAKPLHFKQRPPSTKPKPGA